MDENHKDQGDFGGKRDEESFFRLLASALKSLPDEDVRPSEEAALACFAGEATPDQQDEVLSALARSSAYRRECAESAENMERLTSPDFKERFASVRVAPPPSLRSFLWQQRIRLWLRGRLPVALRRLLWALASLFRPRIVAFQLASWVLVAVLVVPAYRGIWMLPDAQRGEASAQDNLSMLTKEYSQLESKRIELENELKRAHAKAESAAGKPGDFRSRVAMGGGIVNLLPLQPAQRQRSTPSDPQRGDVGGIQASPRRKVAKRPSDLYVLLGLDISKWEMDEAPDGTQYLVQIMRQDTRTPIWSDQASADLLREATSDDGVGYVTIQIPAELLDPGPYVARFRPVRRGAGTDGPLEFPFEVIVRAE